MGLLFCLSNLTWFIWVDRWVSSGVVGSQAFAAYDQGMSAKISCIKRELPLHNISRHMVYRAIDVAINKLLWALEQ